MLSHNSHPSYNPSTWSTTQAVQDAIQASKDENRIVHIDYHPAVVAELTRECEGTVKASEVIEFWGEDCDGQTWRVHVDVEADDQEEN